jgi:hypothetical protein
MVQLADNAGLTHEQIGKARLQIHARDRLLGAYNARYRQDKGGVQVNVGVAVTLAEADRAKLLTAGKRHKLPWLRGRGTAEKWYRILDSPG